MSGHELVGEAGGLREAISAAAEECHGDGMLECDPVADADVYGLSPGAGPEDPADLLVTFH